MFAKRRPSELAGRAGIGHVRYSTTGSSKPQNVQPLVAECADGIWAVAHNGNLVNARALRRAYQEAGAIFQTSTDSEVLVHLLADPMYRTRPRRVERALGELQGAFAFLLMTKDAVMAARDPHGFRPLSIGRLGGGYVFASETCAIEQVGAEFVRDVLPGELVTADARGIRSSTLCEPLSGALGQCIFEQIYFARPDSVAVRRERQRRAHGARPAARGRGPGGGGHRGAGPRQRQLLPRWASPRRAAFRSTTASSATTTSAARSSCPSRTSVRAGST